MIDLDHIFPLLCSLKTSICFCGRQFTSCTELYDCSLLEMLRQRAFLIKSAASHVESDSHCERTDCGMYAEMTLMISNVSFHVYIAAHFVFIED